MAVDWIDEDEPVGSDWSATGPGGTRSASGHCKVDGRLARSQRTFAAVVDAFLDLLEEGDLRPTAARVADRAGVSRRSVYVHFRDLDALFAAAAERHFQVRLSPLLSYDPLPDALSERIAAFVDMKAVRLERVTPVRRAAIVQEPFSKVVADQLQLARERAGAEVEAVFADELAGKPSDLRSVVSAALVVAVTWPTWDTLRRSRGLTVEESKSVLGHMLTAILAT